MEAHDRIQTRVNAIRSIGYLSRCPLFTSIYPQAVIVPEAGHYPRPGEVGLERAKAQGKTLGRPPIDPGKEAAILADLREGKAGIIKLAAAHRVGVGTVQRIKARSKRLKL
jgi:hypothetical protein